MTEYKIPINAFTQYNSTKLVKQVVMRVITSRPGNQKDILGLACDILRRYIEFHATQRGGMITQSIIDKLDRWRNSDTVYYKHQNIQNYNYHQMVFNVDDIENGSTNTLAYILKDIRNGLGPRRGVLCSPTVPTDVMIGISYVYFDGRMDYVVLSSEQFNAAMLDAAYTITNNIAVKVGVKHDKVYTNNSLAKITMEWCDNIAEAVQGRSRDNHLITGADNLLPPFFASQISSTPHGGIKFSLTYNNKVNAEILNDTLVLYDGRASYEVSKPYLLRWKQFVNTKLVVITQFSKNKDFFYTPTSITPMIPTNKILLHYVGNDKIALSSAYLMARNGGTCLEGQIPCNIAGKKRNMLYDISFNNTGGSYYCNFIIPYSTDDNCSERVLDWLTRVIISQNSEHTTREEFSELLARYSKLLEKQRSADEAEDVLSTWFECCTKSSADNDARIIASYKHMKQSLENELKSLATYVGHFDFSKCMAIPKVIMDEKLKNNYYKTLHVEPKNVRINTINNKKIQNVIEEVQPTVSFMTYIHSNKTGDNIYIVKEFPLRKFYDARSNTITFNYGIMKGEVIRDKVKNRR